MKPAALVKGMFAGALFVLLVLAICVMVYNGAVHEFQILQKDYSPDMDWNAVLSEELPVVLRNLPRNWLGKWTRVATGHTSWTVTVRDTEGRRFRTQWSQWLEGVASRMQPTPESMDEIAHAIKLDTTLSCWTDDGFRRWSWLPTGTPTPHVLGGDAVVLLRKTVAEYTVYVATDGAPIELWIAHEGAVPDTVAPQILHTDPWAQTAETIPWINEVKYVEIKIRPGTAVAVPRHWYVAARAADNDGGKDAWCWIGEFHTPISRGIRALRRI